MAARAGSHDAIVEMLGLAPPEHDARGRILVLALYAFGILAGGGVMMIDDGSNTVGLIMGGAIVFAGVAFLAEGVRRFACWSWFFVAGWLVLLLLPMLDVLFVQHPGPAEVVSSMAAVMMVLGALHYLWVRRWDFWADARLDARLGPRRRVSPRWRAVRLSSLGTASEGARPASAASAMRMRP